MERQNSDRINATQHHQDDWDEVHNQLLNIQQKSQQVSHPGDADETEADEVARKVADGQSTQIHGTGGAIQPKGQREIETSPEFQSKLRSCNGMGQSLPEKEQLEMGSKMGADFKDVKIHTGSEANEMSNSVNAKAFTSGKDIYFSEGKFDLQTSEGKNLLAHELTHTVQQSNQPQEGSVQRQKVAEDFPFVAYITTGIWNTPLRDEPVFDETHEHTQYDLPEGHEIVAISATEKFYYVKTKAPHDNWKNETKAGTEVYGYVVKKYVSKKAQPLVEFDNTIISKSTVTFDDAILVIASAKKLKAKKHSFTSFESSRIQDSKKIIDAKGKYDVDLSKYEITFKKNAKSKIKIESIEDFILFVEDVERQYSSSSAIEIASEIRQLWYSDENWDVLVSSQGIKSGTSLVDIESSPNPIADKYDMKDLAPKTGTKKLKTNNGTTDIGHVMAGIDSTLSGSPASFPKNFIAKRGGDEDKSRAKYEILKDKVGGSVSENATWAGDIGQAYGTFLGQKKIGNSSNLSSLTSKYFSTDQMLGDIQGYVLNQFWNDFPEKKNPGGSKDQKISEILKAFFLSNKTSLAEENVSFLKMFLKITGKSTEAQLKKHIRDRGVKMGSLFYASVVFNNKSDVGQIWTGVSGIKDIVDDFAVEHSNNEKNAPTDEKLDSIVEPLMTAIKTGKVK
ncbi:MAG: DUF4157 domain-containing protein [Bacteroidia bacterium]